MKDIINRLLDILSEFLAHRKGLLPIIGIILVICNMVLQFLPPDLFPGLDWLLKTNLLLHLGIILALLGILFAWAL
jgi:hypothetical protein